MTTCSINYNLCPCTSANKQELKDVISTLGQERKGGFIYTECKSCGHTSGYSRHFTKERLEQIKRNSGWKDGKCGYCTGFFKREDTIFIKDVIIHLKEMVDA